VKMLAKSPRSAGGPGTHHHGRGAPRVDRARRPIDGGGPAQPNQTHHQGRNSTARKDELGHGRAIPPIRLRTNSATLRTPRCHADKAEGLGSLKTSSPISSRLKTAAHPLARQAPPAQPPRDWPLSPTLPRPAAAKASQLRRCRPESRSRESGWPQHTSPRRCCAAPCRSPRHQPGQLSDPDQAQALLR